MEVLPVLLVAFGLAADCFAVAFGASVANRSFTFFPALRVSLSFGVFQTLMPVIGWFAGRTFLELIAGYDHWVAFILLALVGGKMLWEAFHSEEGDRRNSNDMTRGFMLLTLSVATSIDALAVGLAFAVMKVNIVMASVTIGIVAVAVTAFGFLLGRRVGRFAGRYAEVAGGLILIGIGTKIVLEHTL